jgi:hypothetical protein
MKRLACVLALVSLLILAVVAVHLDGATATLFSFAGMPALAAAMAIYFIARIREGAFRSRSSLNRG